MIYSHCKFHIVMFAMGILFSCSTATAPDTSVPSIINPVFIVCEGNYGSGNSSLSVLDTSQSDTAYNDVFGKINGRGLGDNAHSMIVVDSLGYIAVTHSNNIEVIHTRTFESVATIDNISSPRNLAYFNSKFYVTSYEDSCVVVLNLAYSVVSTVKLTHRPDEIAILNNKAYVSNAFNVKHTGVDDSTISIIDLNSNAVIKNLIVGKNPVSLAADLSGNRIFVASTGYSSYKGFIAAVDPVSDQIIARIDSAIFPVKIAAEDSLAAYILSDNGSIRVLNLNTQIAHDIAGNFYSVAVANGEVFAGDGQDFISNGILRRYSTSFEERKEWSVGQSPSAIVFGH
jgi:DNA-binding beta-propeller fold protein YncE